MSDDNNNDDDDYDDNSDGTESYDNVKLNPSDGENSVLN